MERATYPISYVASRQLGLVYGAQSHLVIVTIVHPELDAAYIAAAVAGYVLAHMFFNLVVDRTGLIYLVFVNAWDAALLHGRNYRWGH
ncbi:hypothetical protein ACP4OV_021232 [Aristida adscensionis]